MKDSIRHLFREVDERIREASMLGDKEGLRIAFLDVYTLAFLNMRITEGQLRGVAHLIKEYYEKEGNSKGLRMAKRFGSKIYLSLTAQKEVVSKIDNLTSKLLGLD